MKKMTPLKNKIKKYTDKTSLFRIDTNVGRCYTPDPMKESTWKPSVTTMENIISKGIMFERWIANFGGYDKVCEYVGKKADDGTFVHELLEILVNDKVVNIPKDTPNYIKKYIESFIQWYVDTKPISIATEIQMYHKDIPFSGTVDYMCYINGQLSMVDFKTGNEYPTTHQIQLICYKELFEKLFPKDPIKHIYCLYVKSGWRKKPTYKLKEYKYDSKISGALKYLWDFNNQASKTKIKSKVEIELPNQYKIGEQEDGE
jgi:hypothetical protein